MKRKIKTLILMMEGWESITIPTDNYPFFFRKKGHEYQISERTMTESLLLSEAWDSQYANWKLIIRTNLFWFIFSLVLACVFAACSPSGIFEGPTWCYWAAVMCGVYPLGWTLIAIGYMVFNGVKTLLNKLKRR